VKVQDGCRNRCAFCIVTIARGDERSRPIDDVVSELRSLASAGTKEAVLTGVHLGGYGSDLGVTLSDLVRAVIEHAGLPRIRLSSLEPWDLPPDFASLWQDRRLMPHLHLPLQSGSDGVLRRMARRCSTAAYEALVDRLRSAIPDLVLTTDVIVGYPVETEAEWAETMAFVERIGFGHVHVFTYSRREGTRAARLGGQVAGDVKRRRSRELSALAAAMKTAHLARFARTERDVLWEGPGHPGPESKVRFGGYTDNYLRVQTSVPAGIDLDNRICRTWLDRVDGDLLVANS
jgi:threonylcarbamoyladenosine tRNA methylthiotransferase MtaB